MLLGLLDLFGLLELSRLIGSVRNLGIGKWQEVRSPCRVYKSVLFRSCENTYTCICVQKTRVVYV